MDKLYVIKIGGNIIDNDVALAQFLKHFAAIRDKKILVHGGGKLLTRMAEQLGIDQKMIEGRRITDAETLRIVTMVYGGFINKNIVASLQSNGVNAVGLTGADGNLASAHKRAHPTIDYGFVGDIDKINTKMLVTFIENEMVPVIAPLSHDGKGQILNTNADTIAQMIAVALSANYKTSLIFGFEKKGVLTNVSDDKSVIRSLDPGSFAKMKGEGKISDGMLPKLHNAFGAIESGVQEVIIGDALELDNLLKGVSGTSIKN